MTTLEVLRPNHGDGGSGKPASPAAGRGRGPSDVQRVLAWLAGVVGVASVYYLGGRLGLELSYRSIASPVWPPAGVAVAGLLLFLSEKTVEAYVRNIFTKLDLPVSCDDHRRVLAVLQYLRSRPGTGEDGTEGVAADATLAPS